MKARHLPTQAAGTMSTVASCRAARGATPVGSLTALLGLPARGSTPLKTMGPLLAAALLATSACEPIDGPVDYGQGQVEGEEGRLSLRVISPANGARVEQSEVWVEVSVSAADQPSGSDEFRVWMELDNERVIPFGHIDGDRFGASVPLLHDFNGLRLVAQVGDQIRELDYGLSYRGTAPALQLDRIEAWPRGGCEVGALGDTLPWTTPFVSGESRVCLHGRSTVLVGRQLNEVRIGENLGEIDEAGNWSLITELGEDGASELLVQASDNVGQQVEFTLNVYHDTTPPSLSLDATIPQDVPLVTNESDVLVSGSASDDVGILALRLWINGELDRELKDQTEFAWNLRVPVGLSEVRVEAVDLGGLTTSAVFEVQRERDIRLGVGAPAGGSSVLALDRTAMQSLIPEANQRELTLVELDLRPTIVQALRFIKDPVANGVDTSRWGQGERNLRRLLTMTPDTADVSGTSLAEMQEIADAIGLPLPRVVAAMLGQGITEPFIPEEVIADAMIDGLIATHPTASVSDEGEVLVAISLYDAFAELAPLAERFGPNGDHPGFVVGETYSDIFEPGFQFSVEASSSLRRVDGVDATQGRKDYLFLGEGENLLSFDFLDDESFNVVGMVDEPVLNIGVQILESELRHPAGDDPYANPDDQGGSYGNESAWDLDPWLMESLLTHAIWKRFRPLFAESDYQQELSYSAGAVEEAVRITWNRGILDVETSGGIGNPPPTLTAWGLLGEIAQERLHDGGLAEGEADVTFILEGVPVGLSAQELVEAVRPTLQEQQESLSEALLGDRGLSDSSVDVFHISEKGAGVGVLVHRMDEDEQGRWEPQGFFSDPGLTQRVSTTAAVASWDDTLHHKVPVELGMQVYFTDEQGDVFQLSVNQTEGDELNLRVSPIATTRSDVVARSHPGADQ